MPTDEGHVLFSLRLLEIAGVGTWLAYWAILLRMVIHIHFVQVLLLPRWDCYRIRLVQSRVLLRPPHRLIVSDKALSSDDALVLAVKFLNGTSCTSHTSFIRSDHALSSGGAAFLIGVTGPDELVHIVLLQLLVLDSLLECIRTLPRLLSTNLLPHHIIFLSLLLYAFAHLLGWLVPLPSEHIHQLHTRAFLHPRFIRHISFSAGLDNPERLFFVIITVFLRGTIIVAHI